jgi:hypothetical protein
MRSAAIFILAFAALTAVAYADDESEVAESVDLDQTLPSEIDSLNDLDTGIFEQSSVCYGVGDPHFKSFDGTIFHFQGIGQYRFAKCPSFEVQARNKICGGCPTCYYGVVGCYTAAAFKYSKDDCDSQIEVNDIWSSLTFSSNGRALPQDKKHTTKCGVTIEPEVRVTHFIQNKKRVAHRYRVVSIRTPENTGAQFSQYSVYVFEKPGRHCSGLCGNNNGKFEDDLRFRGTNKVIRCKTELDCRDNAPSKPIHAWGQSYLVDGKSIENIFSDSAKKFNKPNVNAGATGKHTKAQVVKHKEEKKKAKKACKKKGLKGALLADCVEDIVATGNKDLAKDLAADKQETKELEGRGGNSVSKGGKNKLIRILAGMEKGFRTEAAKVKAAQRKARRAIAAKKKAAKKLSKAAKNACKKARKLARKAKALGAKRDKAKGARNFMQTRFVKASATVNKDRSKANREISLIRTLLGQLNKLVNCKVCPRKVEELTFLDQNELAQSPHLRDQFQELIQKAYAGHTDVVQKLLNSLLAKLYKEKKQLAADFAKVREARKRTARQYRRAQRKYQRASKKAQAAQRACNAAKAKSSAAKGAYKADLKQFNKDNLARVAQLNDVTNEADMARSLRRTVSNWTKNKKAKKCLPQLDLEEDATPAAAATEQVEQADSEEADSEDSEDDEDSEADSEDEEDEDSEDDDSEDVDEDEEESEDEEDEDNEDEESSDDAEDSEDVDEEKNNGAIWPAFNLKIAEKHWNKNKKTESKSADKKTETKHAAKTATKADKRAERKAAVAAKRAERKAKREAKRAAKRAARKARWEAKKAKREAEAKKAAAKKAEEAKHEKKAEEAKHEKKAEAKHEKKAEAKHETTHTTTHHDGMEESDSEVSEEDSEDSEDEEDSEDPEDVEEDDSEDSEDSEDDFEDSEDVDMDSEDSEEETAEY